MQEWQVEEGSVDVWPEHWTAVSAFSAMGTQWTVGMGGPIGLRYEALPVVLEMITVPRDEWPQVFACLRIMESEALAYFAERRAQRDG